MITSISVSNFRGIKDTMELTIPQSGGPVVDSGITANRTSFVSAVTETVAHLARSHPETDQMPFIPYLPDRIDDPTEVVFRMVSDPDGKVKEYRISFDEEGIRGESLRIGRRRVFDRVEGKGVKKDILKYTTAKSAYLTVSAHLNDSECNAVLREIKNIRTCSMFGDGKPYITVDDFEDCAKTVPTMEGWLRSLGVVKVKWGLYEDRRRYPELGGSRKYIIRLAHEAFEYDWSEESGLVRRLFPVMAPMAKTAMDGGILLVDDFGVGLDDDSASMVKRMFSEAAVEGARMVTFGGRK